MLEIYKVLKNESVHSGVNIFIKKRHLKDKPKILWYSGKQEKDTFLPQKASTSTDLPLAPPFQHVTILQTV